LIKIHTHFVFKIISTINNQIQQIKYRKLFVGLKDIVDF
jgi:hypothetical protein